MLPEHSTAVYSSGYRFVIGNISATIEEMPNIKNTRARAQIVIEFGINQTKLHLSKKIETTSFSIFFKERLTKDNYW